MTTMSTRDKAVTSALLDNSLFAKTGRICDPFLFDASSKLEQASFDGVFQQPPALHFIPGLGIFTKIGPLCQNCLMRLFLLSVVKESKFRVC